MERDAPPVRSIVDGTSPTRSHMRGNILVYYYRLRGPIKQLTELVQMFRIRSKHQSPIDTVFFPHKMAPWGRRVNSGRGNYDCLFPPPDRSAKLRFINPPYLDAHIYSSWYYQLHSFHSLSIPTSVSNWTGSKNCSRWVRVVCQARTLQPKESFTRDFFYTIAWRIHWLPLNCDIFLPSLPSPNKRQDIDLLPRCRMEYERPGHNIIYNHLGAIPPLHLLLVFHWGNAIGFLLVSHIGALTDQFGTLTHTLMILFFFDQCY